MINILEIGLPIADEALFLESGEYLNDMYSYVALGARSSEDHAHRVYASNLGFAVGVKNPSSGDLDIARNSVFSVNSEHTFLKNCGEDLCQVDSKGNKFGHLILRGGTNGPNFSKKFIEESIEKISCIENPALIIDLNHNNSGKKSEIQPEILKKIIEENWEIKENKSFIKGFMVESFLKNGCQNITNLTENSCDFDGLSITDSCLG
jgi:3-deoxy-7-phosphoheptulonate synthase